ncbi:MAG TPA: cobalamin biosynthesis protein [Candidatus Brocadiaceae bacterium]|nr:MAG: cobalamin biosynthesis protein CobD [Planctomycetes bacterium GWA2_39_15]OHB41449.1 MAG: cobalamin biosynthesis protein CobD [Planctomycetes bacterium GWC2_39_26]
MINPVHSFLIQITVAYVVDIIIGDPQWQYHPVRLIGRLIESVESGVRKLPISERLNGIILTLIIVAGTVLATYVLVLVSRNICFLCELMMGVLIIYFSISIKSLAFEAKKVMTSLKENDLIKARKFLAKIVGRDTVHLNEEQIMRACVETVAEGSVDGVLSPLFYSFIGGPIGAIAYKAVNTLDSMVGYKNEKYIRFGWASARLDDVANYIPARISCLLIPMASFLCGCSFKRSLKIALRDGRRHESPNSGIPEAAIAGALGVQLGGPSTYQGEFVEKPFIGDNQNQLTLKSVDTAVKITYVTSILFLIFGIATIICLRYFSLHFIHNL